MLFVAPYYHLVSDEYLPHVIHLYRYKSKHDFITDIDFLLKHLNPISLEKTIYYKKNYIKLPNNHFLLSFDDGLRQVIDIIAPILYAKGLSAVFFINNSLIGNTYLHLDHKFSLIEEFIKNNGIKNESKLREITGLNDVTAPIFRKAFTLRNINEQIIDNIAYLLDIDFDNYLKTEKPYLEEQDINSLIDMGFSIGAHSISHLRYSTLSLDEQILETIDSVKNIRNQFKLGYGVFAFPYSDRKISLAFFNKLNECKEIDITFGNIGLIRDTAQYNIQRISFEKPFMPASYILMYSLCKYTAKKVLLKSTILR